MLPWAGTGATFGDDPELMGGGITPGAVDGTWPGVAPIMGAPPPTTPIAPPDGGK